MARLGAGGEELPASRIGEETVAIRVKSNIRMIITIIVVSVSGA